MASEPRRVRNALLGALGATVVAWLAWPLIGLLESLLMLPGDFAPLATALLLAMIALAALVGWGWSSPQGEEGGGAEDQTGAERGEPQRRQ